MEAGSTTATTVDDPLEENRIKQLKKLQRELLKEREELEKMMGDKAVEAEAANEPASTQIPQPIKLKITRSLEEKEQFTSQINQSVDNSTEIG